MWFYNFNQSHRKSCLYNKCRCSNLWWWKLFCSRSQSNRNRNLHRCFNNNIWLWFYNLNQSHCKSNLYNKRWCRNLWWRKLFCSRSQSNSFRNLHRCFNNSWWLRFYNLNQSHRKSSLHNKRRCSNLRWWKLFCSWSWPVCFWNLYRCFNISWWLRFYNNYESDCLSKC